MDIAEMLFAESCFKEEKIEKFINFLTNSDNPNDPNLQIQYAASAGLDLNELTSAEIAEIETRINNLLDFL